MNKEEITGTPLDAPISVGTHVFDAGGETIGNVGAYDAQGGWFTITSYLFPAGARAPLTAIGDRGASGIYLTSTKEELLQQDWAVAGQGAAAATAPDQGSPSVRDREDRTARTAVREVGRAGQARALGVETRTATTTVVSDATGLRVPVVEEELVVGIRQEEAGRVHLRKEVIEERQTLSMPVTHEELHVERVPVQGDVAASADAFVERTINVPLSGEEVVLTKQARVVEEVRLQKDVLTEQVQVTDTVRKERVIVDGVETQGHAMTNDAQTAGRERIQRPPSNR